MKCHEGHPQGGPFFNASPGTGDSAANSLPVAWRQALARAINAAVQLMRMACKLLSNVYCVPSESFGSRVAFSLA